MVLPSGHSPNGTRSVAGNEGGTRHALIISNDIGNRHSPTDIIAAITGKIQTKTKLPTHTEVKSFEGLDRDSIVLPEQIHTIDKKRLKQYMGIDDMPDSSHNRECSSDSKISPNRTFVVSENR